MLFNDLCARRVAEPVFHKISKFCTDVRFAVLLPFGAGWGAFGFGCFLMHYCVRDTIPTAATFKRFDVVVSASNLLEMN